MPKVKTNSSCKKRFVKNCKGKIKRSRAYKRHHAWAKGTKKNRELRAGVFFETTQNRKISKAMPY
ncbi:MAG: 50S ribosomal protein L35 [Candidatus Babeliales bacterium]|jgi:large subunit ribosomal protein L35